MPKTTKVKKKVTKTKAKVSKPKTKTATKIHNSIQEQMDKASITKLASASNMFGRGLGEKRMILILKE